MRSMFGNIRVTKVAGVGVGPRTYTCAMCGRKMLRSAEVVRRHEAIHGHFITFPSAYRLCVEDLNE